MSNTAQMIRDVLNMKVPGELFCTRELLHLGSRGAIDTYLSRLVKEGTISRLTRGVFARPPNQDDLIEHSARDIAEVKAKAFDKRIISDHHDEARELNLTMPGRIDVVFRVSGRTSKFRFNGTFVHLRAASNRKLQLGDSRLGKVLRAVWFVGRKNVHKARDLVEKPLKSAGLTGEKIYAWIPAWLSRFVYNVCPSALPRPLISAT
jgi:hypothetical protein